MARYLPRGTRTVFGFVSRSIRANITLRTQLTLAVVLMPVTCLATERLELPAELARKVRAYSESLSQSDPNGSSGSILARQIYEWVAATVTDNSLGTVVDALGQVMPVRRNEQGWSWRERVRYRNNPSQAEPFALSTALWSRDGREVLVLTAVYKAISSAGTASVFSAPSVIVSRDGSGVTVNDFEVYPKGPWRQVILGCQGFIEAPGTAWPDLVMSSAGIGRAEGLQVWQLHYQKDAQGKWAVLWREELLYIVDVTFTSTDSVMAVTLLDDVGAGVESHEGRMVFHFRYGEAPVVQLIGRATPR